MTNQRTNPKAAPSLHTLAVRGGEPRGHGYAAVTVPIVCTSTYSFDNSGQIHDHFQGRSERWEYGRYGNPTVRVAELKLAALEAAEDAALFPSGMCAITTLLLAMLKPGDHVVMTSDCYRRTRQFLRTTLTKFGVRHTFVPPDDLSAIAAAIEPGATRLIVTEAPTNPYLRVADLRGIVELKQRFSGVKLLVDTTLATPALCQPLLLGVDLVTHSCTKYLAGHNDVLAGVVCGSQSLVDALHDARGVFGGMPDPHGAYLLVRGMKTLAVRMRQHNESALAIARFLEQHPAVERVFYPGLASHPDHALAAKLFQGGFGGIVSFHVRGGLEDGAALIDAVTLPNICPSMGGVETLMEQPALMSFYELSPEQRAEIGIAENLIRLSVGLEDTEDLIRDLDQALSKMLARAAE